MTPPNGLTIFGWFKAFVFAGIGLVATLAYIFLIFALLFKFIGWLS